jgi:hypothetical protein
MNAISKPKWLALTLVVLFVQYGALAQDVQLTLSKTTLSSVVNALAQAKVFGYAHSGGSVVTFYSIYPNSASINSIQSGGQFSFTVNVDACANIDIGNIITFDYVLPGENVTITGTLSLVPLNPGFKIVFVPSSAHIGDGSWLDNVLSDAANGFVANAPEISTVIDSPLLTNIASQYFTSGTPTFTTDANGVYLSLNLKVGSPVISAYNDVNNLVGVGTIQDYENSSTWVTYSSPAIFTTWQSGQTHPIQTPTSLLTSSNGYNKYSHWSDASDPNNTPIHETGLMQISPTIGSKDVSYRAEFDQAQHVQLSNSLDGSLTGGTVTYNGTTVPSYNDYDFQFASHPGNTSVPNGTLGFNWYFLNWSDGVATQSRTVTLSSDVNLTANYKGIQVSNDGTAFADNSQRKLVHTPNGFTHCVYTSAGHVWYEWKQDGSSTWNPGLNWSATAPWGPLDGTAGGKCPSIDWDPLLNRVIIVWQQKSGTYYTIQYNTFWADNYQANTYSINSYGTLYTDGSDAYASVNANPNIAIGNNDAWVLTFEKQTAYVNGGNTVSAGINLLWGIFDGNVLNTQVYGQIPTLVSGTTSSSINATIYGNKTIAGGTFNYGSLFPLAWQQGTTLNPSQIKYSELYLNYTNGTYSLQPQSTPTQISYSNTPSNYHPSVIGIPGSANPTYAICWLTDFTGYGNPASMRVTYTNGNSSSLSYYGYDPLSCSLNISDDNSVSYFVWGQYQSSYSDQVVSTANLGSIITLSSSGKDIQLSNGQNKNTMYATSYYNTSSAPYYFSAPIGLGSVSGLQKTGAPLLVSNSRGMILGNDKAQLLYLFGGITVDGNNVSFVSIPDSFRSKNLSDVNALFQTQPFSLKSNSSVTFGDWTVMADSGAVYTLLGDSGYISYNVELVDGNSNRTIGVIKNGQISSTTLCRFSQAAYSLNTSNISGTNLKIRITASTNIKNPIAIPVNDYATEKITSMGLAKSSMKELALNRLGIVTDYEIDQNFPNPFNPATTISYQIPKDGRVTIKIFDVIGREVTTLVDEFKQSGRYSVKFDASHLSSGIYFYSIKSGSYNAVKKMSLIK